LFSSKNVYKFLISMYCNFASLVNTFLLYNSIFLTLLADHFAFLSINSLNFIYSTGKQDLNQHAFTKVVKWH